jgi:flagellar biosynthesis protein FliR
MDETIFNLLEILLKVLGVEQSPKVFVSLVGLIMARLVPAIIYTPFFGGGSVPGRAKLALAVALSFLLYPAMASAIPTALVPIDFLPFLLLALKEAMVGFTIGYLTSLIFYGIESAGQMVDNLRGATIAQLLNLELNTQVSLLGQLKLQTAIVLFFTLDGHLLYIRGLFYSFERLPVNSYPQLRGAFASGQELTPILSDLIHLSTDVLLVSMQLAAPVLVCLFLTDIIFGIFNRVAPQINIFFLSISFKMLLGCLMLFLVWDAILGQMQERFIAYLRILYTFIARATTP